jgi:hypothetical protein
VEFYLVLVQRTGRIVNGPKWCRCGRPWLLLLLLLLKNFRYARYDDVKLATSPSAQRQMHERRVGLGYIT